MEDGDESHFLGDPKLVLAATTLLVAAGVGTWKVLSPALAAARHDARQRVDSLLGTTLASELADRATSAADKKGKRSKERRKRNGPPKVSKAALNAASQSSKRVVRQLSALSTPRTRAHSSSISGMTESVPETDPGVALQPLVDDHTPSRDAALHEMDKTVAPENIALPPSPIASRPQSPLLLPSSSASESSSGTPLTPASMAASNASLPPLAEEGTHHAWHWAAHQPPTKGSTSTPQRGRKAHVRRKDASVEAEPSVATFPTLNTLPPPNTPLEVQIEFMRNQVESYRAQEESTRMREEALLIDLERLRAESEQSRQDVSRLQWQLNDMAQREERLLSQVNALTMQLHQARGGQPPPAMPVGIPVPLYQPQPIPYPQISPGHLGFYSPHGHPYANGSPMHAPLTPTSLVSPTQMHPLMAIPPFPVPMHAPVPTSGTPLDTFNGGSRSSLQNRTNDDATSDADGEPISFGLMEAIFKRPQSYAASQGSGSARSARSPSNSLSPSSDARPIHASRSPSVAGKSIDHDYPAAMGHVGTDKAEADDSSRHDDSTRGVQETVACDRDDRTPGHDTFQPSKLGMDTRPLTPPSTDEADDTRGRGVDIYY